MRVRPTGDRADKQLEGDEGALEASVGRWLGCLSACVCVCLLLCACLYVECLLIREVWPLGSAW